MKLPWYMKIKGKTYMKDGKPYVDIKVHWVGIIWITLKRLVKWE